MNRFFDEVHAFIRTTEMLVRGESILIGFSGGPDSMFLAYALKSISQTYRYGWDITLCHLNHGITPRADENEAFCKKASNDFFKMPLIVRKTNVLELHEKPGNRGFSVESLARRERYKFFVDTCREKKITKLATGHQLDDQAETVLMRAIGGSWLIGMAGIPVRRPLSRGLNTEVVRPLLRTSRENVEDYLRSEKIYWFEDLSNADLRYTRNRVRLQVMPLLVREFNPNAKLHLASLGMQAQELEEELNRISPDFFEPPENRAGQSSVRIDIDKLRKQGPLAQRYILRAALMAVGMPIREVTHRRVEAVRDLLSSERRGIVVKLTDMCTVRLDDKEVVVLMAHEEHESERVQHAEFTICSDGSWLAEINVGAYSRVRAEMMAMPAAGPKALLEGKPPEVEYIDAAQVMFPLYVRGRKEGDRLRPLGMEGEKKLQDLLTDLKVPREQRDEIPIVCDQNGIIWVVGHTIANHGKINERTSQVLALSVLARTAEQSGWLPAIE
jgi:tRNA(Ile)-lysidine synthase